MVYSFTKDFPETLKNNEFKSALSVKLKEILSYQEISDAQELQIHFFLEDLSDEKNYTHIQDLLKRISAIEEMIQKIDILAFKKRALVEIRKYRSDWQDIFLNMFLKVDQSALKDYLMGELLQSPSADALKKKIEDLYIYPSRNPDTFLWYFQKVVNSDSLPYSDKKGKSHFFEAFLVLLSFLEQNASERDQIKKMHSLLSAGRYAIVRQIMQEASIEDVKEFLLLATKCHSLSDHDIKIFHSLAEVVYPSLAKGRKKHEIAGSDQNVIWTTQEGYQKLQKRIQQIATVETVENAKEIEIARAHGDLRENAEFKAALEKRDRLQSELKFLSDQLNKCRILTEDDVTTEKVGVGTIVECKNKQGQKIQYTLLGPWDADPDKYILSFQSKLAQEMKGLAIGDTFKFQNEEYTVTGIRSTFKK
jgi:transcription elongation GreA/GreB family factor